MNFIKELRSWSEEQFWASLDVFIKRARNDGKFVNKSVPYMGEKIINEIINDLYIKHKSIAVWYNIEIAYYLCYIGIDDITIVLAEEDQGIKTLCEKINIKYMVVDINEEYIMNKKFDLVIGNPPFSKTVIEDTKTKGKSVQIWPDFIRRSYELCKNGGTVALLHPSSWRDVGDPYELWNIMTSKQICYINMYSREMVHKIFGVNSKIDCVIINNSPKNKNHLTKINNVDNIELKINIDDRDFIPNTNDILQLFAKEGEECVHLIHDSTYHTQSKLGTLINREKTEKYKYPCADFIKKTGPTIWYSSEKKGHFDIPKLIFSNGSSSLLLDIDGKYGLTQYAKGIIDSPENLLMIEKVMSSEQFIKMIKKTSCNVNNKYDHKLIRLFRKDFWKEFI